MNTLTIPATAMAFPLHVPGIPPPYSVALLAWNVLRKLFHIFDAANRASVFGPYRMPKEWNNESLTALAVSVPVPSTSDAFDYELFTFFTSCS